MNQKNLQKVCLKLLILTLGVLILSGCNRLGVGKLTGEAPTASQQQIQAVTTPTIPITATPDEASPSPVMETTATPTGDMGPYPLPVDATQPVSSPTLIPTLQRDNTNAANPYPLQETPAVHQAQLSNSTPYPPPAEALPMGTSTSAASGANPTQYVPPTQTPPTALVATGTSVLTPLATIVKTWFVATDPTTVNLEAGRPQLVVFFAEWCTLCKSIAPVVLNLESHYKDRANFIYLDVDDEATNPVQEKLKYRLIAKPRIYLIDGMGIVLQDWTGYVLLEELQQALDSVAPATSMPATSVPATP